MVTILATVGWLLFDVAVSIMTAGYLPLWEWRALFWGGGTLALLTLIGMIWDYRAHKKDVAAHEQGIADIRAGQAGHTGEIATVAKGSIAIFNKLDQLAGITQTTGQPLATVIETAISKIAQLETKVLRHDAIFWGAISDAEKLKLVNIFTGLGPHSVKIASNGNTDCVELARDLKDCFKKAG
jgi:hypothetical protein